ncbi:GNAT family N-acetyltransferase [Streptomyces sp. XD-27]|uniref:GNAT family N-acetyltransferase n=1 Tax=Streptomyces sp. XD-27 TaxID=3062779 RepID=UPI0026F4140E|nr:GNAT family N-acetyltransferase [Streptomyces sp. XD-27]WKX72211.1 GNAT family N-acetyltransferase [Streptomyces sp. XD-27]
MEIRPVPYDHPDAVALDAEVQLEYDERYGDGGDRTPMHPADFAPPNGLYLLIYDEQGRPIASGGWRCQDENDEGNEDGDAELKRMYVVPWARGRGLARRILAELEESARAAGRIRMVLETGSKQPEAIALYASSGYVPVKKFGLYRCSELAHCMGKPLRPAADRSAGGALEPPVAR